MGVGALGQLVQRPRRSFNQLLENEELSPAYSQLPFGSPGGAPNGMNQASEGIQCPADGLIGIERRGISAHRQFRPVTQITAPLEETMP